MTDIVNFVTAQQTAVSEDGYPLITFPQQVWAYMKEFVESNIIHHIARFGTQTQHKTILIHQKYHRILFR